MKISALHMIILLAIPCGAQAQSKSADPSSQTTAIRSEPVAIDPSDRSPFMSDNIHVLIGENKLVTKDFLSRHTRGSGSTDFGLNREFPDFMYDGAARRLLTRSLQIVEIGDPSDIKCGRTPGKYPNELDRNGLLDKWQIVCTIGAAGYGRNGLTAYQTAIEFGTNGLNDQYGGYMCLSGAPGEGAASQPDVLICHMIMTSKGQFVFGYNTDPKLLPETPYTFKGNVEIDGNLVIEGNLTVHGTIRADDFVRSR